MGIRIGARTDFVPAGFVLQVRRDERGGWVTPPRAARGRWLDRALDTALGAHSPAPGAARERVTVALVARLIVNERPCRVAAPVPARLRIVGERACAHRAPRARRSRVAPRVGAGTGAFSLCVLVAAMQATMPDARAQERTSGSAYGPWYLGLGGGVSRLEPEPLTDTLELGEDESTGFRLFAGYDLSRRFSLEGHWSELGEARLDRTGGGDGGDVGYSLYGIDAVARLGDATRPGLSGFLSAGVGGMENDSELDYEREHDVHLALGAGLEYGFGRGTSLRAELRGFDTDASYAGLSIAKRFGRIAPQAPRRARSTGTDVDERTALARGTRSGAVDADGARSAPATSASPASAKSAIGALAVRFGFDRAELGSEARAEVDALAERIVSGTQRIALQGHADSVGADNYNVGLSVRRAEAVRDRLVERGVDPARIDVRGFGERRPVRSNSTDAGRAANRRVEVLL